jgi:non-ribosomal peptide synthetase component F
VPVGRPIENGHVEVLGDDLRPVPIGVPGELYAGGAGVARGYAGRPARTGERFVPDPLAAEPGGRVYRTGDLVRWLPDGTVEFLGRTDDQVKVRGHRVEPGEVAAAVRAQPEVAEAAVVVRGEPGDRSLVAYAVLRDGGLDAPGLLGRLRRVLPEPMVPSAAVILPALPLNAHGKLDRSALPEPETARGTPSSAPGTRVEQVIADLWADLLEVEEVGRDDDFFSLGGHSVRAMELVEMLHEVFEVPVPLAAVFEHPTVAGLAALLVDDPERAPHVERAAELLLEIETLSDAEVDALLEQTDGAERGR